jgi:hypothetical protein
MVDPFIYFVIYLLLSFLETKLKKDGQIKLSPKWEKKNHAEKNH